MRSGRAWAALAFAWLTLAAAPWRDAGAASGTAPILLDHNRALVEVQLRRKDGTWRTARLWVDTGNPVCFLSDSLARDLGIKADEEHAHSPLGGGFANAPPPDSVRLGDLALDFSGVQCAIVHEPHWLLPTVHCDASLPSTVLKRYQLVLDYPARRLTLATPGSLRLRGTRVAALIQPETGVVQMDALIGDEVLSLALDNGASYSFVSAERVERLSREHADWRRGTGAVGCANMWGWWPKEDTWAVLRVPEMRWGSLRLADVGLVGMPPLAEGAPSIGTWYSRKTARPVDGFLGPNAFRAFRVGIDYADSAVYFDRAGGFDAHDMDLVGLTLRLLPDSSWEVVGVARRAGRPVVEGIEPGDRLLGVGGLSATGATMGTVVDALRGKPGEVRTLLLERGGRRFTVRARVERLL